MAEPMKLVKRTFYFEERNIAVLEAERLRRIESGTPRMATTLTRLLNEVIWQAYPGKPRTKGGR